MFRFVFAAGCVALMCGSAMAQIIYAPVQYQYGSGADRYYYGGENPAIQAAARNSVIQAHCSSGTTNLHNFDGGNSFGQPSPMSDREHVFTDCSGTQEASQFGATAADARHEAYANAARYYRKSDELAAAIPQPDGSWVVPPTPVPTIIILPAHHGATTTSPSAAAPAMTVPHGAIIIIPKKLLDKPLKDFVNPPKQVAMAQS